MLFLFLFLNKFLDTFNALVYALISVFMLLFLFLCTPYIRYFQCSNLGSYVLFVRVSVLLQQGILFFTLYTGTPEYIFCMCLFMFSFVFLFLLRPCGLGTSSREDKSQYNDGSRQL